MGKKIKLFQLKKEKIYCLDKFKTYQLFGKKIYNSKKKLRKIFINLKKQNKKIISYGATAKSCTVFNYCNLGKNLIEAVKKRDQIAFESLRYMDEKTKGLSF